MASLWQYPFVNVFKHYSVGEWKKSTKEGDVTTVMDKTTRSTVYRIAGVIPANNYIQMPKTSAQSLGLTGKYLYLLFKPLPERYFVVHIDVASIDGLIIRISFSNLFKEFKSTSTWLQFPFLCGTECDTVESETSSFQKPDLTGPSAALTKWNLLCLDMHYILSMYLNRTYSYLKCFRLCANMLVKGVFTSENVYEPGLTLEESKKHGASGQVILPVPKEMSYPLRRTEEWHQRYRLIRFPSADTHLPRDALRMGDEGSSGVTAVPNAPGIICASKLSPRRSYPTHATESYDSSISTTLQNPAVITSEPQKAGAVKQQSLNSSNDAQINADQYMSFGDNGDHAQRDVSKKPITARHKVAKQQEPVSFNVVKKLTQNKGDSSCQESLHAVDKYTSLQPDPIMKLKRIIGFGGPTYNQALWVHCGDTVVYPCHAIVVALHVTTGRQRFFIGHADKVTCISMTYNSRLLASGQTGEVCSMRIWNFTTGDCACLVKVGANSLHCLSFSKNGETLCGTGLDSHKKTVVIVWNTACVLKGDEVVVLAKAHTDVTINAMRICPVDPYKMISCGLSNLRVWRLKDGSLRSAAVSCDECQNDEFTDVCWSTESAVLPKKDAAEPKAYACTRSGHVFEVDHTKVTIKTMHRLLAARAGDHPDKQTLASGTGIAVNAMCVNDTFCITGSDDGFLRVWPLDFKHVYLEAEHDGPLTVVQISNNGLQILAGTATGSLGVLDITTRGYTTVMRSHVDKILSMSLDPWHYHVATVSADHSIRIWDLSSGQQLYDFCASKECPTTLTYHPSQHALACGFSSGFARVFDVTSTSLLAEHSPHKGSVTGIAYSVDGSRLYSCDSMGALCMFDATHPGYSLMRNIGNVVARGIKFGPNALALSPNGQYLAFVGCQEFTVTVVGSSTLDEIMKIDITLMASSLELSRGVVDSASGVLFTPACAGHLLVTTANNRLLKFDPATGKLLEEVCNIHRSGCTALEVTRDGRRLVTAGDCTLKVWDYQVRPHNFQVFIGHSEIVTKVLFSSSNQDLLSVGEAIFVWEYLDSVKLPTFERNGRSLESSSHNGDGRNSREHEQSHDTDLPRSWPPPLPVEQHTKHIEVASQVTSCHRVSFSPEPPAILDIIPPAEAKTATHPYDLPTTKHDMQPATGHIPFMKPSVQKHFQARSKVTGFAQRRYIAPPSEAGIELIATFGYNGNGRKNIVWRPETGLFAYTMGCIIIVEDLKTAVQKHLIGHAEEISTMVLQCEGSDLATASGSNGLATTQICIWDIGVMSCKKVLSYHHYDVVAMAYSRDDRFLVSIGDYREACVVVWNMTTYSVLASVRTAAPLHDVQWDAFVMNEFCTVGDSPSAVLCWMVDERGGALSSAALRVHEANVPYDELCSDSKQSQVSFTALCYAGDSVLYVGTSTGIVTAWDTRRNKCFLHWKADSSELSVLTARHGRLISGTFGKKSLRLWNVSNCQEMTLPRGDAMSSLPGSVIMDDEMLLDGGAVAACFDDTLDMGIVGTLCGTLWYINWNERTSVRLVTSNISEITALEPCNDSQFVSCAVDGSLRLWSVDEREQLLQLQVLEQSCLCAAFAPPSYKESGLAGHQPCFPGSSKEPYSQSTMAAGYSDGTVRVFDLNQADMTMKLQPHKYPVRAVIYASATHMLSGDDEGYIAVTSMLTGMTTRVISDHKMARIVSFDVSKQGTSGDSILWLASSADRRVSVWQANWQKDKCELVDWLTFPALTMSYEGPAQFKCGTVPAVSPSIARFSPSESDVIVYTGYGLQRCVQFYSLTSKQFTRRIALSQWAQTLDLSPKGNLIAIGVNERLLRLIDYTEGTYQDFMGHDDAVSLVKFSPSGKYLFSTVHTSVLLWKVLM